MKKLMELTKGNRLKYIIAIIFTAIAALVYMAGPMIIRITLDSIIGDEVIDAPKGVIKIIENLGGKSVLAQNLWICGIAIFFVTLIRGTFLFLKGKLSAEAAEDIAKGLRVRLYNHMQNLPYKYHVDAESGDLIQRCTSDVDTVRRFFAMQMVQIGRALFILTFVIIAMLSMNITMTFLAMIMVPVIFLYSFNFFKNVKKTFEKADEQEGVLTSVLQENLNGVRVVKAFGRQKHEIDKYDRENKKFRDYNFDIKIIMSNYWAISDFLCMIQTGIVFISGIYFVVNGKISLGTLVVFLTYEGMLLWPVRQLGRILSDMGKMTVSLGRISEILDEEEEQEYGKAMKPEIEGNIVFENVKFGYEKDKSILKNVSFEVKKGETVAIVGPTGSGKSSMLHLLLRLYDYEEGSIRVDGIDLKNIERKWMRSNIGMVLQEPFLYSRTIKDNIKIAKLDSEDIEVHNAASAAAVHSVITSFDKGYDTLVGEKGVTLSGGQRQRVAIARTLIKNLPILVFDDSLSAVDAETDSMIRRELNKKSGDKTTFIVSHRISTVMNADKIIVLNHGEIESMGTHEELVNKEGIYKRIWEIQNSLDGVKDEKKVCNQ